MNNKSNFLLKMFIFLLIPAVIILSISLYTRLFYFNNISPELSVDNLKINKIIQLDILNACGEDGIAKKARIYLKNRGFDVVEIGNYPEVIESSIVISRKGDIEATKMLAKAIGLNDSLLQIQIDSSLSLDCSIVIGKDYKKLKPYLFGD